MHSDYIAYVDESGDHSLKSIDPNYPVFVLAFCVFQKTTYVVFESRGRREDRELELEFRRVTGGQNRNKKVMPFEPVFAAKTANCTGLQLADLVARPIGRKILKPDQKNRAYDVINFAVRPGGRSRDMG